MRCASSRSTKSATSSGSITPLTRPTSCTRSPRCVTCRSGTSRPRCCSTISPQARSADRLPRATGCILRKGRRHMAHRGITSFLRHDTPDGGPASLAQALDGRVREGELVERRPDGAVRCFACGHRCLVKPGRRGICKVRFNKDGALQVPAGYVAALQCDPTEKKPFFHALPGSDTLTFGMLGCDFHCGYCQNWLTSQALRDDAAGVLPTDVTPYALACLGLLAGANLVRFSYDAPLIAA